MVYLVFTTVCIILDIISNLEMIRSIQEDMCMLSISTMSFYIRYLKPSYFGMGMWSWDQSSWDTEGCLIGMNINTREERGRIYHLQQLHGWLSRKVEMYWEYAQTFVYECLSNKMVYLISSLIRY